MYTSESAAYSSKALTQTASELLKDPAYDVAVKLA